MRTNVSIFMWVGLGFWSFAWGESCESWVFANPNPQGNNIRGLTFDGSNYLAVGDFGLMMTSPNGSDWTILEPATDQDLFGVAFSGTGYVAVGDGAWVGYSVDGTIWTSQTVGSNDFRGVVWGNGRFIAVGLNGTIFSSTSGTTWQPETSNTSKHLTAIVYGGSLFLAAGYDATVVTSADGVTWTAQEHVLTSSESLWGASYVGGTFFAVGNHNTIFSSPDAITWTDVSIGGNGIVFDVAYVNGNFLAINRYSYSSPTASNWVLDYIFGDSLHATTWGNGEILGVGRGGRIFSTTDGLDWTEKSQTTYLYLMDAAYGNGRYVAVGYDGVILSSTDGWSWTEENSGTTASFRAVDYFNSMFIASGQSGLLKTSPDGTTWTTRTTPTTSTLYGLAHRPTTAIAVGASGTVIYSLDGETWLAGTTPPGTENLWAATWGDPGGGSTFVAVEYEGGILTSAEGMSWAAATSSGTFSGNFLDVAYSAPNYVAVGSQGLIISSTDGDTWAQEVSGSTATLQCVFFDGSGWRAAGYRSGFNGTMYVSDDVSTWTEVEIQVSDPLTGGATDGNNPIIVGQHGIILARAPLPLSWQDWPNPSNVLDLLVELDNFCTSP